MNTQNTNHLRSESHSHDQEPPPILRILREGIVRVVQEEAERLNPEPAQAISRWLDSGDPDAAERFLLRLAEDGDPAIQWCMGMACAVGLGAEKDWPRAIDWFRRSAEQGYAEAQTRMGLCYYLGNDTSEQDCPCAWNGSAWPLTRRPTTPITGWMPAAMRARAWTGIGPWPPTGSAGPPIRAAEADASGWDTVTNRAWA